MEVVDSFECIYKMESLFIIIIIFTLNFEMDAIQEESIQTVDTLNALN
jgi:hypothetical protein